MKTLNIATVFTGIGSFEWSLKRNKIKSNLVFASDIDKYAKMSYEANFTEHDNYDWYDDINEIDGKKYAGKVDILVGGSPCQSFSSIGKRGGLNDDRGNLVFSYINLISEVQPKAFIFENVKGITTHDKGKTWEIILESFRKLGYHISWEILNSKDYGIPQSRNRVFLVGFKDEVSNFKFPKKIDLETKMFDFLEKYTEDKYWLSEKGIKYVTDSSRLKKKLTQIDGEVMLCQVKNQQGNLIGDFVSEEYIKKYVLSEKLQKTVLKRGTTDYPIAKTILSSSHKSHYASQDNYISLNNGRIRRLTPREVLRLMGFDDDFKIVVSDTQAYKQAGNSIVVNIFDHLVPLIIKQL
ncbi:MAG: DNA (cytosine-5-)-methyltransferase [Mycoplasmataceae bacterium]|nr:DNA (cytosine-5-)-methyltransferase [Mycoplasmataceae bacterium]